MEDAVIERIIEIIKNYQENNPNICVDMKLSYYPELVQEVSEYLVLNDIQIRVDDINIARAGMPNINASSCYPQISITIVGE